MFQPLSVLLPNGLGFLQRSFARHPISPPCGWTCPRMGQNVGFTMFRLSNTNDLAPAFTPAALCVRVPRLKSVATDCLPFGLSLISIFGLLNLTMPAAVHFCLGLSFSLTPRPRWCWQSRKLPHGRFLPPARAGMLSRQLPTRPLPAAPVPVELLRTEPQVYLMVLILNNYLNNFACRTLKKFSWRHRSNIR